MKITWLHTMMVAFFFSSALLSAQPYYTQLENVEPFLSPSLSGLSVHRDLRLSASYRSNNLNIDAPFHTAYFAGDGRIFGRLFNNTAWLGWGAGGLFDVAGSGKLSTTVLYANLAYHQLVSPLLLVSGGIGIGVENKSINDINNLSFPVQWRGSSFNLNTPNLETLSSESISGLDIKAGVNLTFLFSPNLLLSAGVSMRYINSPTESFYTSSTLNSGLSRVPQRYSIYGQLFNTVGEKLSMKTSLFASAQGDYFSLTLGSIFEWAFQDVGDEMAFILGAYYRYAQVAVPTVGFKYGKFRFMFSYDIFFSDFATIDYFYRSALETNINYQTAFPNTRFEQLITVCPDHF